MFLTDIKRRILEGLRHGPLNLYVLASELDEAPYRIRAELKGLKRDQFVRDRHVDGGYAWELTDRGMRVVLLGDQEELPL